MLRFLTINASQVLNFAHESGPVEFGRRPKGRGVRRVLRDPYVSAEQLRVEELPGGRVHVENLSGRVSLRMRNGAAIPPGATADLPLPALLKAGKTSIEIREAVPAPTRNGDAAGSNFGHVGRASSPSGSFEVSVLPRAAGPAGGPDVLRVGSSIDVAQGQPLPRTFRTVIHVQGADSSTTVFDRKPNAVTGDPPGNALPAPRPVERDPWQTVSLACPSNDPLTLPSAVDVRPVVFVSATNGAGEWVKVSTGRNTLTGRGRGDAPEGEPNPTAAETGTQGERGRFSEAEAGKRRVWFDKFFSRELAGELDRNPDLLTSRECTLTILVTDIRDFSRITERLGTRTTSLLIGDVLDRLTARIHEQNGVVVDYVGDGILAMWNAPVGQEDHADRACRAATAMIGELPLLNAKWAERIGAELAMGIGVNTGSALVGNTGSRQRMKYGPVGNTVNLASRVEGATKQLGVPVLITGSTRARLGAGFATRRLCQVRVVGIDAPVDLYELHGESAPAAWLSARDAYEAALALYERGRLSDACRAIFPLLGDDEGRLVKPELTLAARAIDALRSGYDSFDPVMALKTK